MSGQPPLAKEISRTIGGAFGGVTGKNGAPSLVSDLTNDAGPVREDEGHVTSCRSAKPNRARLRHLFGLVRADVRGALDAARGQRQGDRHRRIRRSVPGTQTGRSAERRRRRCRSSFPSTPCKLGQRDAGSRDVEGDRQQAFPAASPPTCATLTPTPMPKPSTMPAATSRWRGARTGTTANCLSIASAGDGLTIDGDVAVDIRDFGLKPPNLLLVKVDPVVQVRLHLVATGRHDDPSRGASPALGELRGMPAQDSPSSGSKW